MTATAAQQEQRLAELRQQAEELALEDKKLGEEISSKLVSRADPSAEQSRRAGVRQQQGDLAEAIGVLEKQITEATAAAAKEAAEARLLGIKRAYGSIAEEMTSDDAKIRSVALDLQAAVERLNSRYRQLGLLEGEVSALTHRFSLPALGLGPVVAPARREAVVDALRVLAEMGLADRKYRVPQTERDAHALRTRRTYAEVRDTPSYAIIEGAGLVPWPPLTDKQAALVAEREQERTREQAALKQFKAEATRSTPRPPLAVPMRPTG
jgi:hypothetical protein